MAFNFFLQFGAYQACAYAERAFTLTDLSEAAIDLLSKLVKIQPEEQSALHERLLLFYNNDQTVEGFKPIYTVDDILPGCVIQILLPGKSQLLQEHNRL
ncbi:hypothetical protein AHF37_12839 [Paragonimus kellicotti]|nr:hypothetical protein AHF37_12839 [Paragonimus kellicotti]